MDYLYHVEMPLVEVLADMEYEGVKVDKEKLNELGSQFKEIIKKLESEIYEISGEEFNINSPKQLGVILFEKTRSTKKLKRLRLAIQLMQKY